MLVRRKNSVFRCVDKVAKRYITVPAVPLKSINISIIYLL